MENQDHALKPIWEKMPELFSPQKTDIDVNALTEMITDFFAGGEYYYYLIDIADRRLSHQHKNALAIHGLSTPPDTLQQIIDLIHPEDLNFVMRAEEACHQKLLEIGLCHIQSYKCSYCFRMRVADGSYHLFQHQSISLIVDTQYRIVKSLNIHTDIQHIAGENPYIATVTGINGQTGFHVIDLTEKQLYIQPSAPLTSRESGLLNYIAKGMSSIEIAHTLGISVETVRTHRKNMLRKTQTHNSTELIRRCIELGLV